MSEDYKRLYRSRAAAQLAGVCAGLGSYVKIDPVVVRLLWVGVTCLTGFIPGIVAYLIAWLIVPQEPLPAPAARPADEPHPGTA
jgi:phage shock protein C